MPDPALRRIAGLRDVLFGLLPDGVAETLAGDDPLTQAEAAGAWLSVANLEFVARLQDLARVIVALAAFDYQTKAIVSDAGDMLDSVATGLNMLGEELDATTISRGFVHNVLASMSELLAVSDRDGRITLVNRAACDASGRPEHALLGRPLADLLRGVPLTVALATEDLQQFDCQLVTADGDEVPVSVAVSRLREQGGVEGLVCVARDLRELRRVEQERLRLREAVQRQAIVLEELALPIVPLTRDVVVLPLIGSVDANRAQQVTEALLNAVVGHRARTAIVDITGMRDVGPVAVAGLLGAIQAVRLVGAEVLLTGMRPEVAGALVDLDVDLSGVRSFGDLQRGIAHALASRRST